MGICQSGRAIAVAFDQLLALPLAAFNSRAMKWNKISTERERERNKVWLLLYGVLHAMHTIFHIHIHIHIHIACVPYVNICMQCSVFFPIPIANRVKSWHFITLCLFVRMLLNCILLWFNCIGKNCVNCHKVNQFGNLRNCLSLSHFFYDFFAATCLFMCGLLSYCWCSSSYFFLLFCALFFCPNVQRSIAWIFFCFFCRFSVFLFFVCC